MNTETITQDYHCSITATTSPKEAYTGISRVYSWWASNFEGSAQQPGDIFTVRFGETWVKFQITEAIPNETITWHVLDCNLHWLADTKEWKNTKVLWEISSENDTTRVDMTHIGLIPAVECYANCEQGWNRYIKGSLQQLLNGQPQNFQVDMLVKTSPADAIRGINNVTSWWAIDTTGNSDKTGDIFTVHFGKTFSTIKIAAIIPGSKIVWEVLDCNLEVMANKKEWQGTTIFWDIMAEDKGTRITMTHVGLVPEKECYNDCKNGWNFYVKKSLYGLLAASEGSPNSGPCSTSHHESHA